MSDNDNGNGNGDKGPAFAPAANVPVLQWILTYQPHTGGIQIQGPPHPPLIIEAFAKAISVMTQHVVPKEEKKIVPVGAGALSALRDPTRGRAQ